jgi:hypothetical protein
VFKCTLLKKPITFKEEISDDISNYLIVTEVCQQLSPFRPSRVERLRLHQLDVDDGEVHERPQLRVVVDGLHPVDERQQQVPDFLLVIVEEPHVHVKCNLRKDPFCRLRKTVENIT